MKRAVVSGSAIASQITAEAVVLTLPAIPVPEEAGGYLWSHLIVDAFLNFTPGTGATQVTVRVRRSSLSGSVVGQPLVVPAVAGAPMSLTAVADDPLTGTTQPTIGQVYVVTIQQSAGPATGAGTTNYAVAHTTGS